MSIYNYPYVAARDTNGTWLITFPDVPEAITDAETDDDIPARAHDVLWTALSEYVERRRPLPVPSNQRPVVLLHPRLRLKLALHDAMVRGGVTKAELARRLEVHAPQVDRLLDFDHHSKLEQMVDALEAVDPALQIYVDRMPVPLDRARAARIPKVHARTKRLRAG